MKHESIQRRREGGAKGNAQRLAEKVEGMAYARARRGRHHPVSAQGHMPFAGHRTQAEVRRDEEAARRDAA